MTVSFLASILLALFPVNLQYTHENNFLEREWFAGQCEEGGFDWFLNESPDIYCCRRRNVKLNN